MARNRNPLAFCFEPIDWEALAIRYREQSRRTRKGDKRPREDVEKQKAARLRNKKRKQKEAVARYHESAPRLRQRSWEREVVALMEPGNWYAAPDVAQFLEIETRLVGQAFIRLGKAGILAKTKNTSRAPHDYVKGVGIHKQAARDPEWLWRLTARGEAWKAGGCPKGAK
jgi:hypothetical protein